MTKQPSVETNINKIKKGNKIMESAQCASLGSYKPTKEQEEAQRLRNTEWPDLTIVEQIERMREYVKNNNAYHAREVKELQRKVRQLEKHSHLDGKVMVEYNTYGDGINDCVGISNNKNYF